MSEYPGKAEFEAVVGSEFIMELGEGLATPVSLKQCQTRLDTPVQECFSLLFLAPDSTPPIQAVRQLKHAVLGEMTLFLVPIKRDAAGLHLEAVFNLLR